jgi:polar amino acid transport system substrate-binding protein
MKTITLVLALVLVVAGCSSGTDAVGTQQTPNGAPPLPAGAKEVRDLKVASVDTSCDPTASIRPTSPLPAPGAFAAGSSLAKIYQHGLLRVGVDQNTYKFGFRDAETGQLEGFSLDVAKQLAKAIFGDETKLQLRVVTSAQRIPALKNDDVDLVVHTMTANCERWKDIDFSTVYYLAAQKVLVKKSTDYKGVQSLAGKKVCAAEKSTSLPRIINLPDVKPAPIGMQVSGWTDCLVMMQQNQVDAVSTDDTILAGLAAQDPSVMVPQQEPIAQEPYAIGVAKGHTDLVQFVNAVLDRMRADGTWASIYNKWMEPLLHVPASPPPARYQS